MLLRKSCSVFSSLIIFIEIVCNITLYYLISRLIIALKNSNSYLSLHSSSLCAFNFLIVIIIVEVLFANFNTVYIINFLIALLIMLCVFIKFSLVCLSTIRYLSLILVSKIV
jgi:hypothetical protein